MLTGGPKRGEREDKVGAAAAADDAATVVVSGVHWKRLKVPTTITATILLVSL